MIIYIPYDSKSDTYYMGFFKDLDNAKKIIINLNCVDLKEFHVPDNTGSELFLPISWDGLQDGSVDYKCIAIKEVSDEDDSYNYREAFYGIKRTAFETALRTMHKISENDNISKYTDQQSMVLIFILNFINHAAYNHPDLQDVLIRTFRAGYCYHFALILKESFKRGEICWAAPFSHIVWKDTDGTLYDVEGVYSGEYEDIIPISNMGDTVNGFLHIPTNNLKVNSYEEISGIMKKYRGE